MEDIPQLEDTCYFALSILDHDALKKNETELQSQVNEGQAESSGAH